MTDSIAITDAPPAPLAEALADAFARLAGGVTDRRSAFHTPALATAGPDGAPSIRTVILRGFDPAARRLRIHTDRRSAKAAEILRDGRAMLHGYDPGAQVQLRLSGQARLHLDDEVTDAAWAASRETSRMSYAAEHPPGTPLPAPPGAPDDAQAGRSHFAVVTLYIEALDWLRLDPGGHRRARFAWAPDGTLTAGWIAP